MGKIAAEYGQTVRLENHGAAGDLVSIRKVMDGVTQKNVRIKVNVSVVKTQPLFKISNLRRLFSDLAAPRYGMLKE